jgi:hypothetical protein
MIANGFMSEYQRLLAVTIPTLAHLAVQQLDLAVLPRCYSPFQEFGGPQRAEIMAAASKMHPPVNQGRCGSKKPSVINNIPKVPVTAGPNFARKEVMDSFVLDLPVSKPKLYDVSARRCRWV